MTRGPQDRLGVALLAVLVVVVLALTGAVLGSWHDLGMIR